jgi:hypothetical protein
MGGSCALQEDVSCRARIDDQLRELGNGSVTNAFELQVEGCCCSFIGKLVVVDTYYYYCNSMSLLAEGVEKKCNKGTMVHWCSPVGPISPQGAGLAWGCTGRSPEGDLLAYGDLGVTWLAGRTELTAGDWQDLVC